MRSRTAQRFAAAGGIGIAVVIVAGCAGAGGGGGSADGEGVTLNLATVSNPQMKDMEQLKGEFEKEHPDIKVNFIQMEENDVRDAITKDIATKGVSTTSSPSGRTKCRCGSGTAG